MYCLMKVQKAPCDARPHRRHPDWDATETESSCSREEDYCLRPAHEEQAAPRFTVCVCHRGRCPICPRRAHERGEEACLRSHRPRRWPPDCVPLAPAFWAACRP